MLAFRIKSAAQIAIGLLFLRLLLGFIFTMQGYGKVFKIGVQKIYESAFLPYTKFFPEILLQWLAYFTSYVELFAGLLLLLGLFRMAAYISLAAVLLIVSFGHGLMEPIWNLQHVFVRSVFLTALFLIPLKKDLYSLDHFLLTKTRKK